MSGTNASNGKLISNDISRLTGNYYFAIQEILTNGSSNSCNINYGRLICQTYTYENPGTISFTEKATNTGKTVTVHYPEGCGDNLKCTYQKDNGEEVEVKSTSVNVEFSVNGNLVSKVTDEKGTTTSSSYTVSGIVTVSVGSVRGGSITLSKNKAVNGGTVSFTTSPSSGFTYQGATVVCNNGTTHKISSSSKTYNSGSAVCGSTATIYPSWKKNDSTVFYINQTPSSTGWIGRYDTNAGAPAWNTYFSTSGSINGNQIYYLATAHTSTPTRAQLVSQNLFNLTDYSTLWLYYSPTNFGTAVGTGTVMLATIPQSQGNSAWVHGQSARTSATVPNDRVDREMNLNISSLTGNYYLGVQLLSTNGKYYAVDYKGMRLYGTTYSYTNRGV